MFPFTWLSLYELPLPFFSPTHYWPHSSPFSSISSSSFLSTPLITLPSPLSHTLSASICCFIIITYFRFPFFYPLLPHPYSSHSLVYLPFILPFILPFFSYLDLFTNRYTCKFDQRLCSVFFLFSMWRIQRAGFFFFLISFVVLGVDEGRWLVTYPALISPSHFTRNHFFPHFPLTSSIAQTITLTSLNPHLIPVSLLHSLPLLYHLFFLTPRRPYLPWLPPSLPRAYPPPLRPLPLSLAHPNTKHTAW